MNIFADARLAKVLGDALTNGSRGKGQAINLHEEHIFLGVCELWAHLQHVDLQVGIYPTRDCELCRALVPCGFMFVHKNGVVFCGVAVCGLLEAAD